MDRDHYSDKDCFLLGIGWDYRMKGEDTQRYQLKDECILDNLIIQDVAVLGEDLEEANEEDDLVLGSLRESIPLRGRAAGRRNLSVRDARGRERPRPVDAVRLHHEADERSHSDTAVLDLSCGRGQQRSVGRRKGQHAA